MKTKSINVKCNLETHEALMNTSIHADSPHWLFILCDWIQEADKNEEIELTDCFDFIQDNDEREKEVDRICKIMDDMGISFYRILTEIKYYNKKD